MSSVKSTAYYATFGGRRRRFCLRLGEMAELEQLCDAGIGEITKRLALCTFKFADVRETVRLGLIGGENPDLPPGLVDILLENYLDNRPLLENLPLAQGIISALMEGVAEVAAKMPGNQEQERSESPATSPASSPPEQSSE